MEQDIAPIERLLWSGVTQILKAVLDPSRHWRVQNVPGTRHRVGAIRPFDSQNPD